MSAPKEQIYNILDQIRLPYLRNIQLSHPREIRPSCGCRIQTFHTLRQYATFLAVRQEPKGILKIWAYRATGKMISFGEYTSGSLRRNPILFPNIHRPWTTNNAANVPMVCASR
jgi:hypothetical protein